MFDEHNGDILKVKKRRFRRPLEVALLHNSVSIGVFSVSSVLQRPYLFPPLRSASEWWYIPVVDSFEKAPRQKPYTSCHLP